MKVEKLAIIKGGRQDGAVFGNFMFSFDSRGICTVYELDKIKNANGQEVAEFSSFELDKINLIKPHSNAVVFGNEYFDESDEFPLLYSNIYNNYAGEEDKKIGMCTVYRLQRNGDKFTTTLVQIIRVDFTDNEDYWKSHGEDVRPYGNFVIDKERNLLCAFTMRDESQSMRYFTFDLPKVNDSEISSEYNVPVVRLCVCDIKEMFDMSYQYFIQGACCSAGKVYSLEGFNYNDRGENLPSLRAIDICNKTEVLFKLCEDYGINVEPEMIDYYDGNCYMGDHHGNIYKLIF